MQQHSGSFILPGAPNPSFRELPWDSILLWVVRLRFTISSVQILLALSVQFVLRIDLPLGWIFLIAGVTAVSNLALYSYIQHPQESWKLHPTSLVTLLFLFDTATLTILLLLTGGPTNPFTVVYLVYMTLSAATLKSGQTWVLGSFSTLCFGLLFLFYRPIAQLEFSHHGSGANLHLVGMWIGFLITVFLVATFAGTASKLLKIWQNSLLELQKSLAKKERMASLATLAAGAAHELNTPLGTIAILAKELEHQAEALPVHPDFAEDCRVIRQEVDRCRQILLKLSGVGPNLEAQAQDRSSLADLVTEIRSFSQRLGHPVEIILQDNPDLDAASFVRYPVFQSITALLKNAADASPRDLPIHLSIGTRDGRVQFRIQDHGSGMSDDTLRRIGEPFFTTKEPGKGMGLGAFLACTFAEQLGGQVFYQSARKKGTLAVFEIPLAVVSGDPIAL
ncbi:MAG TPA: ATP-binding protein [Candidatus Acidoferrales bacterium]|nr:ATP-binding protein [Candidatus Acidoferrales bacterium]